MNLRDHHLRGQDGGKKAKNRAAAGGRGNEEGRKDKADDRNPSKGFFCD